MAVAFVAIAGFAIDAEAQVETDSTFIFNYNLEWNAPDANVDPNIDIIDFDSTDVEEKTPLAADRRNQKKKREKRDWSTWRPDTKKALWLAIVLPGAGQIYNRKYWKLPIFYGGFLGCAYALTWNGQMLRDYSQAYLDIMDNDPNTKSYEEMLPLGYNISGKEERFKTIFKNKKNYFRKYRDLSIFAFAGVYLISVIDAYVDAQLSSFDISKDLSLRLEPTFFETGRTSSHNSRMATGLTCKLNF